jgi:transposase
LVRQLKRWVVKRSLAWLAWFRRLASNYERTAEVLVGWYRVAFVAPVLQRLALLIIPGS